MWHSSWPYEPEKGVDGWVTPDPGEWYGLAVDLVTGQAWDSSGQVEEPLFGLPEEVRGCLDGT